MMFRVDDVSINTDLDKLEAQLDYLRGAFAGCEIMVAVSPLVFASQDGRCFPKWLNAFSDHTRAYSVERCGIPDLKRLEPCRYAAHGLVHVDHRLLHREAQELSIEASCALVDAAVFVPPFNKWNADTEAICEKRTICLVKYEDGWRSIEHEHRWRWPDCDKWYFHAHMTNLEDLKAWAENVR